MIINYWGDVMCPFCFIGEIALTKALERFPQRDEVEVRWKSCLLHSDMPQGTSISFVEHLRHGGNDTDKIERKIDILKDLAAKHGVEYGLDKAKVINSTEVARLLKLATEQGRLLPVAKAYGKAYFSDGVDLSSPEEVTRIGIEAGLSPMDIERVLSSDDYLSEVTADQVAASQACPRFIPTVYFNHGFMVDGILDEEQLLEQLQASYKQWKAFTFQLLTMDDQEMGPDECAAICDMPAPY